MYKRQVKSARLEGEPTAELDPILWVSVPNADSEQGGAWMETACFHIELEGMYFLVPVTWASELVETIEGPFVY